MTNTTLPQVTFPNGQSVCALGQGTWKMGQLRQKQTEEIQALRHGIKLGLTLIDTAELYNNEELVGEAIHPYRDQVFLVSKVLPSNASYNGTKAACERSLKRLGTDYIDLYLLHWQGRYPYAETVRALHELQQNKKIRMWGVSNIDTEDMNQILSLPYGKECATNQVLYNLKSRGVEFDLIPWCNAHHMPLMAYSPVGEGQLLDHPKLITMAQKHKATPAQIALAWTIRHSGVIAIPKAGTVAHVDDNFRSLTLNLSNDDLHDLDSTFPAPTHKIPLDIC